MSVTGLVDYAINNLWCVPGQDKQVVFKPYKISSVTGVVNKINVAGELIKLPILNRVFFVYQIGQIYTDSIGIDIDTDTWVKVSDYIIHSKVVFSVFNVSGRQINLNEVYIRRTNNKNLIIAVKKNTNVDLFKDAVYFRVYSSSYLRSLTSLNDRKGINIDYLKLAITDDILILQNTQLTFERFSYAIINGLYVKDINLFTTNLGDEVELIRDSTIEKKIDFDIQELQTFVSSLDRTNKYLLDFGVGEEIVFFDDIDFYITNTDGYNVYGLYLGQLLESNIRMITHRVLAVSVSAVSALINELFRLKGSKIKKNFKISALVRKTGAVKKLGYERLRLKELYKLPPEKIMAVLTGTMSGFKEWSATNLEKDILLNMFSTDITKIKVQDVINVYGYEAVNKLVYDNIFKVKFGEPLATPVGFINKSTVYEYTQDGIYLGRYPNPTGDIYTCKNTSCGLAEFVYGIGGQFYMTNVYTHDNIDVVVPNVNYRVYVAFEHDVFIETFTWKIASLADYSIVNGIFVFKEGYIYQVKTNETFISYDTTVSSIRGVLEYDITEIRNYKGDTGVRPISIPLGELTIILNGFSLVRDIDYYFVGSKVTINNKMLLKDINIIHTRFTNFCTDTLEVNENREYGFVKHGLISNNGKFDIRDNKVMRVVVDGRLVLPGDVNFFESVNIGNDVLNGRNYEVLFVKNSLLTIDDYIKDKGYEDKVVTYLNTLNVQIPENRPNVIQRRYVLYSTFLSRLIYTLSKEISTIDLEKLTSDYLILSYLKTNGYDDLFKVDPLNNIREKNEFIIEVHPSLVDDSILDIYAYRFLTKVMRLYEIDKVVELSNFVKLKNL